jgi:ATP-binding cassette subfamily B protein
VRAGNRRLSHPQPARLRTALPQTPGHLRAQPQRTQPPASRPGDAGPADELSAELATAYRERMATIGFGAMARQFPGLVVRAIRLGCEASRWDTFATIAANLASGVFTGYALLASTSVLQALFAAGPTPGRVRAAIPSLILVAAAVAIRSGLQAAAGWSQAGSSRRSTGWWRPGCSS